MEKPSPADLPLPTDLGQYPLLDAIRGRRSRRFVLGMRNPGGALAYESKHPPRPLSEGEEAALVFAANGITGHALADLCYEEGQGANIMAGFVGRAIASGDGIQTVSLVVTNDDATYLLQRPQDLTATAINDCIEWGRQGRFLDCYRLQRLKLCDRRCAPPAEPLFNLSVNRWSAHAPGTSCFLPINDLTLMYINGLLEIFNESTAAFVLDERANFQPAGLAPFARSKGGHLNDCVTDGRLATIKHIELLVSEFVTVEQGMMLQNLGLMSQALGLGGFPYFANHEFGWFQALGFRMGSMPASRYLGAGRLAQLAMRLLGKDAPVPYPLGLDCQGQTILRPFCPPYYPSMTAAVDAVVERKFGPDGIFRRAAGHGWCRPTGALGKTVSISATAIAATKAYCEYVWNRYGRFPAHVAPFRTVMAYQAGHLDLDFYDRFYQTEAVTDRQRRDFQP